MSVLYIAGSQPGVGKTAFSAALAELLMRGGKSVTLVKPVFLVDDELGEQEVDLDTQFYQQILPANPASHLMPIPIPLAIGDLTKRDKVVRQVADLVMGLESEIVIMEGLDGFTPESPVANLATSLVQSTDACVVALTGCPDSVNSFDELMEASQTFGSSLAGLIINGIPQHRMHEVTTKILPSVKEQGTCILGNIPEDRRMLAPTVQDLMEHLKGEYYSSEKQGEELVEYLMVGGWFLDPGDYVLSKRNQKAVLVNAERPDLQMAALNTSTVCLVLTGGQNPIQYVTHHAELMGIPIILVNRPTVEAMDLLDTVLDRSSVRNRRKITRFGELLNQYCDMENLYGSLCLSG